MHTAETLYALKSTVQSDIFLVSFFAYSGLNALKILYSDYYNAYKEDIRASYGRVGFDDANCCVIISYHSNEEVDSSVVTDQITGDIPRSWIKSMEIYTATEE